MQYIAIILVFATVICTTHSLCNTCTASGLACSSPNSFRICVDGLPQGDEIDCPGTSVCTSGQQICAPEGSPSSCQRCGICNDDSTFTCNSYSTFSFCKGGLRADNVYQCPDGLVCNVDADKICVNSTITGLGATCSYEPPTTQTIPTTPTISSTLPMTTPNPETSPNQYCENKGFPGRYAINADSTCKKFISCILSGNAAWIGNIYVCPKDTYFSATSQACGKVKPANCA